MTTMWSSLTKEEQDRRINIQMTLEEDLLNYGIEKYWKEYQRAVDEGEPEQLLLESCVDYLEPLYQAWIDKASSNKKSPDWLAPLLAVGARKMADITIRSVMRLFLNRNNIADIDLSMGIPTNAPVAQQVAKMISDDVVAIVAYQQAKHKFKDDWLRQSKFIKNWTPKRCKAFTEKMLGIPKLSSKQREDFGHNMLRIAIASDILQTRLQWNGKNKKALLVCFSPKILKELANRHDLLQTSCLVYRPMIAPPVPHTVDKDGGYYSPWVRKRKIKRYHPVGQDASLWDSKPSELVIDALNAIMNTEWSINKKVLDIMETMFYHDYRIANLPASTFQDFAFNKPYPKDGPKEEQAKWMVEANEAWGEWYKEEQSRSRMLVRIQLAKQMLAYGFFYQVHTLDFRGREYTACELLSCQGVDFDKALLMFSVPKEQTPRGLWWLKVHVANLFDQDKLPFEDRVKWVDNNMKMLKAINDDPFGNKEWISNAKKKNNSFQRLAAVFELFRTDGMTQLPVQMDGANNGVQHWSAIMHDATLAELTNVVPNEKPQDLYRFVAHTVTDILKDRDDDWSRLFLGHWHGSIDRSVTKRPTMTDAYGVTFYGVQKYLKLEGHLDWVSKDKRNAAVTELARAIKFGLEDTMTEPNKGKEWLREVARIASDQNKPLVWTTPCGFVVQHVYNQVVERVSYAELFNRQQLVFCTVTSDLDGNAQYLGISPNFIHSLDSSHMFCTVWRMYLQGINAYSFVHDSYGTYAVDIDEMNKILREEFANMHKENLLERFKKEVEERLGVRLPDTPKRSGELNIGKVLDSKYFFS